MSHFPFLNVSLKAISRVFGYKGGNLVKPRELYISILDSGHLTAKFYCISVRDQQISVEVDYSLLIWIFPTQKTTFLVLPLLLIFMASLCTILICKT